MKIERVWAMPNGETFEIAPVSRLLDRVLVRSKIIVDPFARNSQRATITNDLNPSTTAKYHLTSDKFSEQIRFDGIMCDAVLFDPPYSSRQIKELYESVGIQFTQKDGQLVSGWTTTKDNLTYCLREGGVVVNCGWNSNGFGKKRGFELEEVLLIAHGGGHNDTIITVERKHSQ